ncbi:MAG: 6-hydroxymethylpterin diphosphokinase MptE-like protein [Halobacteriota archaeon]|uniref:6-hydroxymethylpterin diphosphokinase MptE-like protein n=1 Tax=Natronomonas sp. TaxID=2184060 RepID=UPI003975F755
MLYDEWKPAYEAILDDFGYDRADDERARDRLFEIVSKATPLSIEDIELNGTVAICGGGPTLADELDLARRADRVVAASVAADVCLDAGIAIDCMVTDLDKNPETARQLSYDGVPVAVHAHGDNQSELERNVPTFRFGTVLPTTQAAPCPPVCNPGGFTDGDRAAFLADTCGADRLVFPGWSFDDPSVGPEKARKLQWAERLLYWLEDRRSGRFAVLDGRRGRIDRPWK